MKNLTRLALWAYDSVSAVSASAATATVGKAVALCHPAVACPDFGMKPTPSR